jgi:hypothetical protein
MESCKKEERRIFLRKTNVELYILMDDNLQEGETDTILWYMWT